MADTVVLIPVYNDWAALALLLPKLSAAVASLAMPVSVLVVDDGSTTPGRFDWNDGDLPGIRCLRILRLRRNLGHQRALAAGLVYVHQHVPSAAIVVMDGDGEDPPAHVPLLLREFQSSEGRDVVFAARTRRMEGVLFRLFYRLYRLLHLVAVGLPVRVGNFSVVSAEALDRLVVSTELWNHYAAAIVRSRLTFRTVPLPREGRLAGGSKMNFADLLVHGLSALSVFGDIVVARLLAVSAAGLGAACLAILTVLLIRTTTTRAIPGWATYSSGIATVILIQFVMISFLLILSILAGRTQNTFLPIRDCPYFFGGMQKVFGDE